MVFSQAISIRLASSCVNEVTTTGLHDGDVEEAGGFTDEGPREDENVEDDAEVVEHAEDGDQSGKQDLKAKTFFA